MRVRILRVGGNGARDVSCLPSDSRSASPLWNSSQPRYASASALSGCIGEHLVVELIASRGLPDASSPEPRRARSLLFCVMVPDADSPEAEGPRPAPSRTPPSTATTQPPDHDRSARRPTARGRDDAFPASITAQHGDRAARVVVLERVVVGVVEVAGVVLTFEIVERLRRGTAAAPRAWRASRSRVGCRGRPSLAWLRSTVALGRRPPVRVA